MLERILTRFRDRVRARRYVMTLHAEEEMDDDGLSIFDVESAILTGKIVQRQIDGHSGERKYLVRGWSVDQEKTIVVVVKLGPGGRLVILTVYTE